MAFSSARSRRQSVGNAFTLVELLVVIGIIAVLIAILLPTLAAARAAGDQTKCAANLRSIGQALFNYAVENKGAFPYGIVPVKFDKTTYTALPPVDEFYSWPSMVAKYTKKDSIGDNSDDNFPGFQKCPSALKQSKQDHHLSYVGNMVVFPDLEIEGETGAAPYGRVPGNPPASPTHVEDILPFTMLVWDTAVFPNLNDNSIGYVIGADIDGQRFWSPGIPQQRYWDREDSWSRFSPNTSTGSRAQEQPIVFAAQWQNIDPVQKTSGNYPFQGNVRFRHGSRETICNGLMGDGSVYAWAAKLDTSTKRYISSELRRKNFMPRWPTNIKANPNYPS